MQGKLAKLTILSYMDSGKLKPNPKPWFRAYYNPDSYSVSQTIQYCAAEPFGNIDSEMRFLRRPPKEYSFKLIFDGTGASGEKISVPLKIEEFNQVTYGYIGESHRTPYLVLYWGTMVANVVLKSSQVSYKLFDPMGIPLRAEMSVTFSSYNTKPILDRIMGKESPDMTHRRVVQAGDTLPLLCKSIYNDESKYLEVARINGLVNYRNLRPGSELYFPPIKEEA